MESGFRMHAERTPDPDSIRWVLGRPVADCVRRASFEAAPRPEISPLASRLFAVEGVEAVVLGPDSAIVSKRADRIWSEMAPAIVASIRAWVEAEEPALGPDFVPPAPAAEDPEIIEKIRHILEVEIGPYVAQDGGEIVFVDYVGGVVEVSLRGACAGCPSSSITLKMGIEARLKQEIPEVVSVVAV